MNLENEVVVNNCCCDAKYFLENCVNLLTIGLSDMCMSSSCKYGIWRTLLIHRKCVDFRTENLEFCSVGRSRRDIFNVLGVCKITSVVAATWNTQLGW